MEKEEINKKNKEKELNDRQNLIYNEKIKKDISDMRLRVFELESLLQVTIEENNRLNIENGMLKKSEKGEKNE